MYYCNFIFFVDIQKHFVSFAHSRPFHRYFIYLKIEYFINTHIDPLLTVSSALAILIMSLFFIYILFHRTKNIKCVDAGKKVSKNTYIHIY